MSEATIAVADPKAILTLFGTRDQHLRKIREVLGVAISGRDDHILVQGEEAAVAKATNIFEQLRSLAKRHGTLLPEEVSQIISRVNGDDSSEEHPAIELMHAGRPIRPRTAGQAKYVQAIREHDLTFCMGPAGTGKTYLAVAMAVQALKQEIIRKIVLVRPAVEAGESLGYLPGDMQAKINPIFVRS
jgi:phosphate starvation-inducible protein PhoH and related proteins